MVNVVKRGARALLGFAVAFGTALGLHAATITTTALTASAASSNPGTTVTFTATVTGGTPTGLVQFRDNGSGITGCTAVSLVAGVADCATNTLPSGPRSITADYLGDASHDASASSALIHTVNAVPTTTTITAAATTSTFGQAFTFTATVTAGSGGTPIGTITFKDSGVTIPGCSALAMGSGAASCLVSSLTAGSHSITAEYAGNVVHLASTSAGRAHTVNAATTTTTITAPATSSTFGTSITFTASVASAGGTPTGTVTFKDGGTTLGTCSAVSLTAGAAACALTTLSPGAHTITAEYNGVANFLASASAGRAHTINAAATTTAVSAASTTSVFGAAFTFTATVTSAGVTVNGDVTFKDGGVDIAGCVGMTLAGGPATASCSVGNLTAGAHSITAVFAGNASFLTSTSTARAHTVTAAPTTTTLSGAATTSLFGESVSFTATVASAAGTPGGTVTFKDTGTIIAGCNALPLAAGAATCTTAGLLAGSRSITAEYAVTASFAASTSAPRAHSVTATATTTTLTSDAAATTFGQLVVFTATVASANGTPTGNVAFRNGGVNIASCSVRPLASGVATCSISSLPVGSLTMSAVYAGTTSFSTSTSADLAHTVSAASTTTTLTAAISSTTFGQSVTFVATIASSGSPITGTVAFRSGGSNIAGCAAVTISSSTASCTTNVLAVGSHVISALYAGNASFTGSTSADRAHDVSQATTAVSITGSGGLTSTFGQSYTFTATVSSSGGTPTGTVVFKDAGVTIPSCSAVTVSGGLAACPISTLVVGAHSITAEYLGSVSFIASTSGARAHTVNQAPTTTSVTAPSSFSNFGSSVTFTASVTSSGGVPTGTVTFQVDGVDFAACVARPLASGSATCAISTLALGAHTLTAAYSGATSFAASTSVVRNHTVNQAITSIVVAQSGTSSTFGQNVTFTATVSSAGGSPPGAIAFKDGGVDIPSCSAQPVTAGVATCVVNTLVLGPHIMTASYIASTNFAASNSTAITHTVNGIPTTTAVGGPSTSVFGASATFTATVNFGAGTPVGTVTFRDNGISIPGCSNLPVNGAGVATCSPSGLTGGSHPIVAAYLGGGNFAASTSSSLAHTVSPAPTTTVLTGSSATSAFGDSVTFTATVTSGSGTPNNSVAFRYGATTIPGCGAVALDGSGVATCTTNALPGGTHAISATYSGSTSFAASTSGNFTHTVSSTATTTAVTQDLAATAAGSPVTFTATVTPAPSGAPLGTVAFRFGATTITACTFSTLSAGGVATCTVSTLPSGVHTITAVYTGNASHGGSTSPGITHTVAPPAATTTVLSASPVSPSTFGQSVALTATVSTAAGTPTGTVSFRAEGLPISGCNGLALVSGIATCNTTSLAQGARTLSAVYGGSASYLTSTSADLPYTVNPAGTTPTTTTLSAAGTTTTFGQSVTFVATVGSGSGTPTGTVLFKDGVVVIASCNAIALSGGTASCAIATLAVGAHSITAEYAGTATFQPSASAARAHTVSQATTTTTLSAPSTTSTLGSSITFTAAVASSGGTPTGTVTFRTDGVDIAGCLASPMTSGSATCAISTLALGARSITAVYSGATSFAASTSSARAHTVTAGTTTTALTASPAGGSGLGQSVTLTATVSTALGTPTGTVALRAEGVDITGCAAVALVSNVATCNTTTLALGARTLSAVYGGSASYLTSTSANLAHTVSAAAVATTTTLTAGSTTTTFGQSVTFVATVASGSGTPTGTVLFKNGGVVIGTCNAVALSGGTASCAIATLAVGAHSITAEYAGTASFQPSASAPRAHTVSQATTTTTLGAPSTTSAFGSSITFTATVASGGGTPGGTITFRADGTDIASCIARPMASGAATCAISTLALGARSITAVYSGTTSFAGSTSAVRAHTVTAGTTTTALTASPAGSSNVGQSVTLTATISTALGTPTGTVAFRAEGVDIAGCAAVALVSGVATCSTTSLALGARTLSAVYGGSASYLTSTSANLAHTVSAAAVATTTTLTAGSTTTTFGQSVTFVATVASGSGTPTGTVLFKNGGVVIGTCNAVALSGGTASCAIATLAVGAHGITAEYAGTASFLASASAVRAHTVSQATTTTTLTAPSTTSAFGSSITFTATVASSGGTPGGTVTFRADGADIPGCTARPMASGSATCAVSTLAQGARSITAVYSGATSFVGSTSAVRSHTVTPGTTTTTLTASPAGGSTFGQSVTLTATVTAASGTVTGTVAFRADSVAIAGCGAVALVSGTASCVTSGLPVGTRSLTAQFAGSATYATSTSSALSYVVSAPAGGSVTSSASSIDFGGQSMFTTSPSRTITLTNGTASPVTFSALAAPAGFGIASNACTTVAAAATCQIALTFRPTVQGVVNGALSIAYGGGGPIPVALTGVGEFSLVTHYYRSILRRAPDAGGKAYWEGEAARVAALGANVNETWYSLATQFFFSAEYAAFNRSDIGFVTDLYTTFFNRAPDSGGQAYWLSQLSGGMPREVVLVSFMFSTEFTNFTQAIFGNAQVRAEMDVVVDFYRGLLSRLPDNGGFNYWVGRFRAAQCAGAGSVYTEVESISNGFANSAEYGNRGRSHAQFVGDMYNSFLRRGGDLPGVQYWIGQLATGARTRENVRQAFISTPEFSQRVQAVISQGCL